MMRNVRPIRVVNSARGLVAPPVQRIHSMQPVDLNPRGATISVEVDGQNPFESMDGIEIVTQASGGMSAPDRSQMSRTVLSQEVAPVTYSMIPGMGLGLTPEEQAQQSLVTGGVVATSPAVAGTGTALPTSGWSKILETVAGGYGQNQATKLAEANAKVEAAKAEAAKYKYQGGLTTGQAVVEHKGIAIPLMAVAGLAIGVAVYLKVSGKNRKIGGRKRKSKR